MAAKRKKTYQINFHLLPEMGKQLELLIIRKSSAEGKMRTKTDVLTELIATHPEFESLTKELSSSEKIAA